MRSVPLAMRLATIMVAIVLMAIMLTVTLDALKFRQVLRAQEDGVHGPIASGLAEAVEDGINRGQPLAALSGTEQALQRRRAAERDVLGITVFDAEGVVRFDTDRARVGTKLPAAWRPPAPGTTAWRADLPEGGLVAFPVVTSFGRPAGGVVVRYDLAPMQTRMNAIFLTMVRTAAAAAALSVLIAVVAAALLTRAHRAWFLRTAAALVPGSSESVPGAEPILLPVHAAGSELDTAERALMRLGTGDQLEPPMPPLLEPPLRPGLERVAVLERRMLAGCIVVTLLLLVLTTAAISRTGLRALEREVLPGMKREAAAVGTSLADRITRAVGFGMPADRLDGVEGLFAAALDTQPVIGAVALATPDGSLRHQLRRSGTVHLAEVTVPVIGDAGPIGTLRIGTDRARLRRSATDSLWDILVVLLACLFTTLEAMLFLVDRTVSGPRRVLEQAAARIGEGNWATRLPRLGLDAAGRLVGALSGATARVNERSRHLAWLAGEIGRQGPDAKEAAEALVAQLPAVPSGPDGTHRLPVPRSPALARAPLFLCALAEALSASFVPLIGAAAGSGAELPVVAAALPVATVLAVLAAAGPVLPARVGRHGARTMLWLGCLFATLGYAGAALAVILPAHLTVFVVARAVTALGLSAVVLACRSFLTAVPDDAGSGRLLRAASIGAVCGIALGGVLAERLGMSATFALSAMLAIAAGALAASTMDGAAGRRNLRPGPAVANSGGPASLLSAILAGQTVLGGFVLCLSPLALHGLGQPPTEIGRQVMLYPLAMLPMLLPGSRWAGRPTAGLLPAVFGGVLAGAGLLTVLLLPMTAALPVALAAAGAAHGLAVPSLLASVPARFGSLGALPRIGLAAGPVLAAALFAAFGVTLAIAAAGAVSLLAAAHGAWDLVRLRKRRPG